MMLQAEIVAAFEDWYQAQRHGNRSVPKGTIAGGLVVLDRLKEKFELDLDAHLAPGGAQIKDASGTNIKRILARFGETRHFASEGGRTNRGLRLAIKDMLEVLEHWRLNELSVDERNTVLDALQSFLVEKVREFHSKERLKIIYDPSMSTWQAIYNLLELAQKDGKGGPVAQHLVGAKLQLRFPNIQIGRESYSTADEQSGRQGDFRVGDTIFHVTVAPMPAVYDKCERNISNGFRVYLIVPYDRLVGVRQNIEMSPVGRHKITAESIESFVSQNVEELADFSTDRLADGFYRLLEEYNKRIAVAEADKSMLVEIPQNLLSQSSET